VLALHRILLALFRHSRTGGRAVTSAVTPAPFPALERRSLATPTWRTSGLCPDVRLIPSGKLASNETS
jgi:hypothetical protein